MMPFIGRRSELHDLVTEFESKRPSLVVMYGRRRIGKSTLLQEAAKSASESIYFQATTGEPMEVLDRFKVEIANTLGDDPVLKSLSDWEGVLNWLAGVARSRPGLTVILDEFPYLVDRHNSLPSIIQKIWDSGVMKAGSLKLVLCGSLVSYMQDLLTVHNPLFGRRTMSLELTRMPLREASSFLSGYTPTEMIETYCVFGGVPHYLSLIDTEKSVSENIFELILRKSGPLFDEPEFLLRSEFDQPGRYSAIIGAVASGANRSSEIAGRIGLKSASDVTKYVAELVRMLILEKVRPFDGSDRDVRYVVVDPLMRFWHRFVRPNISSISRGLGKTLLQRIHNSEFPEFMGLGFEDICREHLRLYSEERFSVPAQEIGKIWTADFDLDIVGKLFDRSWVFGECKWTSGRIGEAIYSDTVRNATKIIATDNKSARYALFSKSGFTEELRKIASVDNSLVLYDLNELVYPSLELNPRFSP